MWITKRKLQALREQAHHDEWADCQRMLLQVGFIDRITSPDYQTIRKISEVLLKEGHAIQISPLGDGQFELVDLESLGRLDDMMSKAVENASMETVKNLLMNQEKYGINLDIPPRNHRF